MTTLVHSYCSRHVLCIDHTKFENVGALRAHLVENRVFPKDACFFICNGKIVDDSDPVQKGVVYHTYPRILGGKGGFGSMLRAIGAQIEKTTNHEALRDLSGRRMRDVNNEKALKEWLAKQSEKEHEREQRRQERLARRRAMPNHKFDDPTYDQQRALLAESQEEALNEGLKKAQAGPSTSTESRKRKTDDSAPGCSKQRKTTEWLGIDVDNLSDLESDEEENSNSASVEGKSGSDAGKNDVESVTSEESSDSSQDKIVPEKLESSVNSEHIPLQESEHKQLNNVSDSEDKNKNDNKEVSCTDSVSRKEEEQEAPNMKSVSQDMKRNEPHEKEKQNVEIAEDKDEPKGGPVDLDKISSVDELLAYGLDSLKEELMRRGLKCGGTLEQRAERLYSVKGLTQDQIDPSLFAKNGGKNLKKKN